MRWNYKDLTKWINNGCNKLIGDTITELDISTEPAFLPSVCYAMPLVNSLSGGKTSSYMAKFRC